MGFKTINEWANLSDMQQERNTSPVRVFIYVESGDINGVDYVTGSEGQLKTLIEYRDLAKASVVTTTTFKYQNSNFPTKVTEMVVI